MRRITLALAMLLLMCSGAVLADHHEANAGVAAVPVGAEGAGIVQPGDAYEFSFRAQEGDYLYFATMLAESNDGFIAPNELGIALYDMGTPVIGDITNQVYYWDLGSERNEPIGTGIYQALRQTAPNSGPAGDGMVRLANELGDNWRYPSADELVFLLLAVSDTGEFTLRIENISYISMYPSPITPVFWIVAAHDDMMMMDDDMAADDDMMDDDMAADDDMMDDDMAADDDMMDDDMAADDDMMDDDMAAGDDMMDDDMAADDDMMDDDMAADDDMMDDDMAEDDDMMDDDMAADDDMMDDDMAAEDDMMMKHGILFTTGLPDYGHGLESLAEDGDPSALAAYHGVMMDDMDEDDDM